jgi:cytochrome c peroxidase
LKSRLLILAALLVVFVSFRLADKLFTVPPHFPKPKYDFSKNPLSENKILLGRALFYDPILSRNNTISCASCHSQYSAFTHTDHDLSHGIEDRIGIRNSPTLMNLAWKSSFMWDGAVHHLDVQSLAPINSPTEMDEKFDNVVSKLQTSTIYPGLFYTAFGDSIITGEYTLKAISQFMLTLVSANSKYDSVMRKQAVFTTQESNGYKLFKKNCSSCHTEPLFTNDAFRNNGLPVDTTLNDLGRFRITKNSRDTLFFNVPTLRNIAYSFPYMHDGRFKNLSQVLNHYTNGIVYNKQISKELQSPLILSSNEKVDIVAFLLTLSDKEFLFNPQYSYPKEVFFGNTKY